MTTKAPATERVQAFVEEALRWLPSEPANAVRHPPTVALSESVGPRSTIVLAEDNADMLDYVHGLLTDSFDVTAVVNGQAALDAIHRSRPDLVLSDVMMPVLDGFELLKAIRADPAIRDIPVILLSARATEEDQIEGLNTGADDYVTKPFSAQQLRARVHANLSLARMRREAFLVIVENEEKLHRLNERLEMRIQAEVQTHKGALLRLAQAEKTAALGQLAGGMAHDFNNILQAVSGYASLIQQMPGDEAAVRRMAIVMEEAARRGEAVTQRLLMFAHQDGSHHEAVDLKALLEGLWEVLTHTLGASVVLALDLAAELPSVLVGRSHLETVLINIAINAGDAMPDGGTLKISAGTEVITNARAGHFLPAGTYVRLSVEDTGIGMDAATLARVTEPFFTTKQVGKGTGLGLAMASSFAEQSQGALTIVSTPGRGTTVTLLLPSTDIQAPVGPKSYDEPAVHGGLKRSRILLVDDEPLVRSVIGEMLQGSGYDVIYAGDAAAALDVLKADKTIDLLLSDLSMPGLDGISLIRAAQSQRPSLPAVLLTGYAVDAPILELGGSFSLLRKPVSSIELTNEVEALLNGSADKPLH